MNLIRESDCNTGKAIIQVSNAGQNAIILYDGANQTMDPVFIDEVLSNFQASDILVLQNEINLVPEIIDQAWERGMQIALNPSPANEVIRQCYLGKVRWLLLNEIEGEWLTGKKMPEEIADALVESYPNMEVVLTLGGQGVLYRSREKKCYQEAFKVDVVDTTGSRRYVYRIFPQVCSSWRVAGKGVKDSVKSSIYCRIQIGSGRIHSILEGSSIIRENRRFTASQQVVERRRFSFI